MQVKTVGIVDYCRSPISKAKDGALNALHSLDIATQVVKKLLKRNPNIPVNDIEFLTTGCAFPEGENGFNIARAIVIKSGLPISLAGATVNHFCASSQLSTMILADMIAVGKGDIGISVGLEHMRHVPMGGFNTYYDKELYQKGFYISMGETAENLARELNITREEQEEFAIRSHRKALKAWEEGDFKDEVVPIELPDGGIFDRDETPREPDPEKIRGLDPAFDQYGTITPATSSPVTTGAVALIVINAERARELGIPLKAKIVTTAVAGCDYTRMGIGPLPATEKALKRANLTMEDIDIIELNEAFAAQSLYVIKKGGWDINKVNILGGAIAIGHPLGMSGARIIGTAITALNKVNGKYGLATMCVGGGQGASTILERE